MAIQLHRARFCRAILAGPLSRDYGARNNIGYVISLCAPARQKDYFQELKCHAFSRVFHSIDNAI